MVRACYLLMLACFTGCYSTYGDGLPANYRYYNGNLSETHTVEFASAYRATREALADLGMPILHEEYNGLEGEFETTNAAGDQVLVYVEELDPYSQRHTSRVGVRVGFFGDRKGSGQILEQVAARVKQVSPGTVPINNPQTNQPPPYLPYQGNTAVTPPLNTNPNQQWQPTNVPPPNNSPYRTPNLPNTEQTLPP